MSFKILADTFSVARDASHFVQLKTLKSPRTSDQVWVAMKIEGDTKYARSTMQSLVDTLDEVFFDNLDLDVYERFENALKEVNLTYKNLKDKRGANSVGSISAIMAVFSGHELHLTQTADAEAYLVRKGKLSLISEGLSSRSQDLFVNIATGELMPEDKIIFATSRLLRLATHTRLARMCQEGVVETLDAIRELVLTDTELSIGVACISTKVPHRSGAGIKANKERNVVLRWLQKGWDHLVILFEEKTKGRKLPMKKKNILIALLVVIVLLFISIRFLANSRREAQIREEYVVKIEELREEINRANTKGFANDKETANAILMNVEDEAQKILASGYFRSEVTTLLEKVEEARDIINNARRVNALVPYADLSEKRESVDALGLLGMGGNLFAYEYNALYEVILDQVLEPRTIDPNEVVTKANVMKDQGVIIFMTEGGKMIEYANEEFRIVENADGPWKRGVDLATYDNFLYVLSPNDNQIYKYTRQRDGYSAATEYNLSAELAGGLSIAIDGNVFVLKEGGEIVKLFKGERQDLVIEDMMGIDISQATEIFTTPDLNNMYLLDPSNARVIIIQKEVDEGRARYKEQIKFEDADGLRGVYVNEDENTLYVTTKKSIVQVEI